MNAAVAVAIGNENVAIIACHCACVEPRQLWWLGTASATALGLALVVFARRWWARAAGMGALVLPHVIGAPHVDVYGALTPADLIDTFIVASLVTAGIFWMVLGTATGFVYRRLA